MPIFICKNVYKSFKSEGNERVVLNNVSCSFPNKGLISICGKSGCGKSTLLNILAGIEKPTSGAVLFCNNNISKYNDKKFSKYHIYDIAIVFQHYNLFDDLTVFENILLPLDLAKASRKESVRKIDELLKNLGIGHLKNRKCDKLSGGEKQRVAICRALVNDPKVILCDEPTGALDSENAILIMNILKDISKTKLVILVSHNNELVKKYSDGIYVMKDGTLSCFYDDDNLFIDTRNKRKYSSSFLSKFTNLLFKKKRTILSISSLTIGFTFLLISIGFCFGSSNSELRAFENCKYSYVGTIAETTFVKIENSPLTFQKTKRPNETEIDAKLDGIFDYEIKPNYSYFFSNYPLGILNGKPIEDFEMIPQLNFQSSSLNDVVINSQFAERYSVKIADKINISSSVDVSYQTSDSDNPFIKDSFIYSYDLNVIAIDDEFDYLNSPKIYYSYYAVEKELKNYPFEAISKYTGKYLSAYDLLISSNDDDVVSSYSDFIFIGADLETYFDTISYFEKTKDSIQITSNSYQIYNSYVSFISTFSSSLFLFVIISFLGILLLLGFISFSSFIQNKKQTAVLTCLGSRNSSIIEIYLNNTIVILLLSLVIGTGITIPIQILINNIVSSSLKLNGIINIPFRSFLGIPFGLPLIIFAISFLIASCFTVLPILFYRKINIADELRDE